MDQENKKPAGAPSNDTTSALFVSARKKQLEQQEADRRAKEKEDQRLAAEAEVRRLEREVEERRRKAEEDAAQSALTLQYGDEAGMLMIMDATEAVSEFGDDVISAAEALMEMMVFGLVEDNSDMPTPTLQKVGDYVSGGVEFETGERFIKLQAEVIEDRLILFVHAVQVGERASFEETASDIAFSLIVDPANEPGSDAGMEDDGYEEPAEPDELMEPDEPVVDPDAAFDAAGEVETLGMVVFYPSSSFMLGEQSDQYTLIEDVYGHGASFMVVIPDISTDSDASVYRQLLDEMVNNSLSEQSDVSLGEMRDIQLSGIDGYAGSEMEASYTDSAARRTAPFATIISFVPCSTPRL